MKFESDNGKHSNVPDTIGLMPACENGFIRFNPNSTNKERSPSVMKANQNTLNDSGEGLSRSPNITNGQAQLTCERCGNKTDGGAWLGFVYIGAECLTKADQEYIE